MKKEIKVPIQTIQSIESPDDFLSANDNVKHEKVQVIPIAEIDPFPEHPFRVHDDESMREMVNSVKLFGVHNPALVRRKSDCRYELISGHRRKMACILAGIETMPCIVLEMDDNMAVITLVDSNLHRETILPSERAKAYKMRLDALKRQADLIRIIRPNLGLIIAPTRNLPR